MEQLIIPIFSKPHDVTICKVMEYVAYLEPEILPPSKREIRLAIDLAKQMNPLFTFNVQEHTDLIRRILRYDVDDDYILSVKPFKQILFKEIIVSIKSKGDGKYNVKLKRVRKN